MLADSSLEAARRIRTAIREREAALALPLLAYDRARTAEERYEAASNLIVEALKADGNYDAAKLVAGRRLADRDQGSMPPD